MMRAHCLAAALVAATLGAGLSSPPSSALSSERTGTSARAVDRGLAWISVPGVDSDHDGRDDKVQVRWRLPAEDTGRVPVVVEASPYFEGLRTTGFHDVDVDALHVPGATPASTYRAWLLRRGYAYVEADSLGSGGSTGCPSSGGENETAAMVAVVQWLTGELAGRDADGAPVAADWSAGRVGMIGVSYNGTLANAVAATGVEGLDAVVPISAISSWYDYYRSQGMVRAPGGYQGEDADLLARAVLTRRHPGRCDDELRALGRQQDRRTGDLAPFWLARDYRADAAQVTAGVLALHGTRDDNVFSDQAGRWAEALVDAGVPVRSWWHTGRHGDLLAWKQPRPWRRMVVDWFDHFLRDVDNGVLDTPASTVVTRTGATLTTETWPGGDTATLSAGPITDGRGRLRLVPGRPDAARIIDDARFSVGEPAPRLRRLVWRSAPLVRPLHLSGHGTVDVEVSVDAPAANVSVALVTLGHSAEPRLVSAGWADPQNHASLAVGEALQAGSRYRLSVDLDQVLVRRIKAGLRLGLVVMSSDREHTLRPPRGTRLRIHTAGTRLVLPVVGGQDALAAALTTRG